VRGEFENARKELTRAKEREKRLAFKFPPALIVPTSHIKDDIKGLAGNQNGGATGTRGLVWMDRRKKDGKENPKAAYWLSNYFWWPLNEPKNESHKESWRFAKKEAPQYREAWEKVTNFLNGKDS
jgi:hypothetical protein